MHISFYVLKGTISTLFITAEIHVTVRAARAARTPDISTVTSSTGKLSLWNQAMLEQEIPVMVTFWVAHIFP